MEVIEDIANIFDDIYEHRRGAKDRSVYASVAENHPRNHSSFLGLEDGESELLYSKTSERDRANLEEFQMISMVGRGTFGKVFLVYLPSIGKYYALKSMRKDVIIDKNSIENINLERLIML